MALGMTRFPFLRGVRQGAQAERGQALVMFAAGLVGFLGLVGMAVDVGQLVYTRTDLQKAADAAALAGSQNLPASAESARSAAESYLEKNGASAAAASIAVTATYSNNDTITVTANRRVEYVFLRFVGLSGGDVSAQAAVRVATYSGGSGLVPWGLIASNNSNSKLLQNSCYTGQSGGVPTFQQNVQCTLKYGAGTNSGGDFGSLALDSTGGDTYRDNIARGSTKTFKVGDQLEAQTGNMVGPTGQGLGDRLALPPPSTCSGNDRSDVLKTDPSGVTSILPGCESSPRIIIIPVVNQINNPQMSTLLGFAFMFITAESHSGGGGGHAQVSGEFVKFVTEIPGGVYQGTSGSGAIVAKLVE